MATNNPFPELPTAEQIAAKRDAALSQSNAEKSTATPISAEKMDNVAQWVTVGTLRFTVRAPSIRRAAELSDIIEAHFPALLVYAALGDENGHGIDPGTTAAFWSEVNANDPDLQNSVLQSVTADTVEHQVRALGRRIVQEFDKPRKSDEGTPRIVDVFADALWLLAHETPGWTRETLPQQLEENLSVPQLADLLRVMNRCVGSFPGDMAERFASP